MVLELQSIWLSAHRGRNNIIRALFNSITTTALLSVAAHIPSILPNYREAYWFKKHNWEVLIEGSMDSITLMITLMVMERGLFS